MSNYTIWSDIFYDDAVDTDVVVIAQRLGRDVKIVEDGWQSNITDAAIHPERDWFAWKEYREQLRTDKHSWIDCNHYLHIVAEGVETLNWTIKTYNPVFGCVAHYFKWSEDRLVMVYHENHRYYGVSCSTSKIEKLIDLAPLSSEGSVGDGDNVLYVYFPYGEPIVSRYELPNLVEMDEMSVESALGVGVLVVRQ